MSSNGSSAGEFAGLIGYFRDAERLRAAIELAREQNITNPTVYMPLPDKSVVDAIAPGDSPVRFTALMGGLTGIGIALAMTIGCSWNYPLVVGGKSITSWPPFLVISFELMVLFGTFGALAGFLLLSLLPHVIPEDGYSPRLAEDTYALYCPCRENPASRMRVARVLEEGGADEIRSVYR